MNNKYLPLGSIKALAQDDEDGSLKVDLGYQSNTRLGITVVWDAVDVSSLGASLTLLPGIGPGNNPTDGIRYATNDLNCVNAPPLAAPVLIDDENDIYNGKYVSFTVITLVEKEMSRFMQLLFKNQDSHDCDIYVVQDV